MNHEVKEFLLSGLFLAVSAILFILVLVAYGEPAL